MLDASPVDRIPGNAQVHVRRSSTRRLLLAAASEEHISPYVSQSTQKISASQRRRTYDMGAAFSGSICVIFDICGKGSKIICPQRRLKNLTRTLKITGLGQDFWMLTQERARV